MKFDINIKNINSMQFTVWIFKIYSNLVRVWRETLSKKKESTTQAKLILISLT